MINLSLVEVAVVLLVIVMVVWVIIRKLGGRWPLYSQLPEARASDGVTEHWGLGNSEAGLWL